MFIFLLQELQGKRAKGYQRVYQRELHFLQVTYYITLQNDSQGGLNIHTNTHTSNKDNKNKNPTGIISVCACFDWILPVGFGADIIMSSSVLCINTDVFIALVTEIESGQSTGWHTRSENRTKAH